MNFKGYYRSFASKLKKLNNSRYRSSDYYRKKYESEKVSVPSQFRQRKAYVTASVGSLGYGQKLKFPNGKSTYVYDSTKNGVTTIYKIPSGPYFEVVSSKQVIVLSEYHLSEW